MENGKVIQMQEVQQYVVNMMYLVNGVRKTILTQGTSIEAIQNKIYKENTKDDVILVKIESIKSIPNMLKGIEKKKWNMDNLIDFTNRYTSLLLVKMSPAEILETLYREGGDPVVLKLMYECNGKNRFLDEAMDMMPKVFPKDYVGIIKASRSMADMYGIMLEITKVLEVKKKIYEQISNIRSSLLLPIVLAVVLIFGMSLYITPIILSMYQSFNQVDAMPFFTMLSYTSALFTMKFIIYFIGIIFAMSLPIAYKYKNDDKWSYTIDEIILGLPILGKLLSVFYEIQFLRVISLAKKAQLPDIESFKLARETQTNTIYKNMINNILIALNRNEDLSTAFTQNPFLSEDIPQVYKIAVKSNNIAEMFNNLAMSKENYIMHMTKQAEKSAGLVNKILLGLLALALAYLFYFPMMNMSSVATKSAATMQ